MWATESSGFLPRGSHRGALLKFDLISAHVTHSFRFGSFRFGSFDFHRYPSCISFHAIRSFQTSEDCGDFAPQGKRPLERTRLGTSDRFLFVAAVEECRNRIEKALQEDDTEREAVSRRRERETQWLAEGGEEILRNDAEMAEEDRVDNQEQHGGDDDGSQNLPINSDLNSDMDDENDAPMEGLVGMLMKISEKGTHADRMKKEMRE